MMHKMLLDLPIRIETHRLVLRDESQKPRPPQTVRSGERCHDGQER